MKVHYLEFYFESRVTYSKWIKINIKLLLTKSPALTKETRMFIR